MTIDKSLLSGSNGMLILKLLSEKDMYGYEMIETLFHRSDRTFELKAGTLYPLLHGLEEKDWVEAYDAEAQGRVRRYYKLTEKGRKALEEKEESWNQYAEAVRMVLRGGEACG